MLFQLTFSEYVKVPFNAITQNIGFVIKGLGFCSLAISVYLLKRFDLALGASFKYALKS
jgi:hypothetical protein